MITEAYIYTDEAGHKVTRLADEDEWPQLRLDFYVCTVPSEGPTAPTHLTDSDEANSDDEL